MHIVKKKSTLQVFLDFFSKSELWTLVDNILSMCSQCLPASALLLKVPDDKNDDDDDGDDDDDDDDRNPDANHLSPTSPAALLACCLSPPACHT